MKLCIHEFSNFNGCAIYDCYNECNCLTMLGLMFTHVKRGPSGLCSTDCCKLIITFYSYFFKLIPCRPGELNHNLVKSMSAISETSSLVAPVLSLMLIDDHECPLPPTPPPPPITPPTPPTHTTPHPHTHPPHPTPADTLRNNDVVITSKRRHFGLNMLPET